MSCSAREGLITFYHSVLNSEQADDDEFRFNNVSTHEGHLRQTEQTDLLQGDVLQKGCGMSSCIDPDWTGP